MKIYLCAILLVSMYIKVAAQADMATAKWMHQPVIIDGRLTEWKQPLNFYDSDTKLLFDIASDSNNIYFCFESKDEISQAKLMRAGMKITLSTKGRQKHEASIAYPLPQKQPLQNGAEEIQDNRTKTDSSGKPLVYDLSSYRNRFIQTHQVMEVEGFSTAKGEVPLINSSGITAAINWDSTSDFIYEIAISEKEFFGADYAAKDVYTGDIILNVEINAVPHSSSDDKSRDKKSPGSNNAQDMDMKRGQFNGGGYNAGNAGIRQMSEEDKVSLSKKSSFKQKFVLGKNDN